MNLDMEFNPFPKEQVSLHDCRITRIGCEPDAVVFYFQEGFTLIDGSSAKETSAGQIRLHHCTIQDIECKLIKCKATKRGCKFSGREISIDALNKLLDKNHAIEIFLELYDVSFLYWRCELYSPKRGGRGLFPHIVIEADDFSSITILYDDPESKQE